MLTTDPDTDAATKASLFMSSLPRSLGFLLVGVLLLMGGCSSGPPQPDAGEGLPLDWDTIFREAMGPSTVSVSPNGKRLAVGSGGRFRIQEVDGSAGSPTDWVNGTQPTFSTDGTAVAWLRDGALLSARIEPSPAGAGAPAGERIIVEGLAGMRAPRWSPDGRRIAVYAGEGGAQNVWIVDLGEDSPQPMRLTEKAAEADDVRFAPQWSPDGRWIAYVSNEADWWHDDVWVVEVATGSRYRVSDSLMASSSPIWAPASGDGAARLVIMGTAKSGYWYQDLADLFRIDLDLSGREPRVVREDVIDMQVFASDYIMRFDPFPSSDGATVFFPYHQRGAFDLWAVPVEGGVATRVTHLGGTWSSFAGGGTTLAFIRDAPTEGREAWLLEASGGPARPATSLAPTIAEVQRPIEISFRSFDGLYIQGFLYLPPSLRGATAGQAERQACPALVQVHGGGTNSYYQGTNPVEQVLAARGFPVLAINYRGGSGFGRAFQDLAVEDWLNDQSKDPGAAADWIRRQPWSNGKVGIYGGSYGGMQSMSAITRTPDKFDAAVPMRGIYSEARTLPSADRLGKIFAVTGHGGFPDERPDTYEKTETLARMERITAPVLVMHGERDVRAPFENYLLAVERLEQLGKEFEAKSYDEGHGFRNPDNLVDMYSRLEGFFTKHLGSCVPSGN